MKGDRRTNRRPPRPRLSPAEGRAVRAARALGLYLLFEGAGRGRVARIYSAATGLLAGSFYPATGRYRVGGGRGAADWETVLALAAGPGKPAG